MADNIFNIVKQHVNDACGYGVAEADNATEVRQLIDLLLTPKGIEHCMAKAWPMVVDMKPYRKELLVKNVIIDGNHTLNNPRLVIAFGGTVTVSASGYSVCEIYATNDAVIHVEAVENAYVSVELHHSAKVFESAKEKAKVLKFKK